MNDLFTAESASAVLSPCGLYRYLLTRTWDDTLRRACFLMLNPSTADATINDPTITRCIGFAQSWGCGGIEVVNLFAFRATEPKDMRAAAEPVGPDNDRHIVDAVQRCHPVVVAWGADKAVKGRDKIVLKLIWPLIPACLGITKDRHPRHPLFLAASTKLVPYVWENTTDERR